MKITIDSADKLFSQFIRIRDGQCMRCHSEVSFNDKGLPVSHQTSHYFGRARENTRFDEENADTLCMACHRIWGSEDKEGYRDFKVKQLGIRGFKYLTMRANTYKKRDRKLAYLYLKERLKDLL